MSPTLTAWPVATQLIAALADFECPPRLAPGAGPSPLAATCAVELADELDVQLTRIEWLQLDSNQHQHQHQPAQGRPVWRSGSANQTAAGAQGVAILDYVTRAGGEQTSETKLTRVVHLIVSPTAPSGRTQRAFVCRVANQLASAATVVHLLEQDPDRPSPDLHPTPAQSREPRQVRGLVDAIGRFQGAAAAFRIAIVALAGANQSRAG